jgi:hypothetical protein
MEPRTLPSRPDVSFTATAPRVTPTPPRASRFGEVLSNTVVRSAESAMKMLPGAPVMAVAVRSASGGGSLNVPMTAGPEGPSTTLLQGARGTVPTPMNTTGLPATTTAGTPGNIESSLQQSQEMNLYFLQIQEAVNAQNRSFTTLSNVMKAEHETVKTAIGNIR